MQLLSLGMFVFELPTVAYQDLERRTDWRHAQNSRIGVRPAGQFLGPGDDVITLSGSIPDEIGDAAELDTLREMADAGEGYQLVDARGRVHGAYVILDMSERQSRIKANGTARLTEFTITLRHVDDPQQQSGQLGRAPSFPWF